MNQLTAEQIKTREDAFASYPEDFPTTSKYASMDGIQEQLKSPTVDSNGNNLIFYMTPGEKSEEYSFSLHKMIIGEQNSK